MAKEIERKYLVKDDSYKGMATGIVEIAQGYLSTDPDRTVRIRIIGENANITVKTRNHGAERNEWEYEIPADEAKEILEEACVGFISKTRYLIPESHGLMWEVDEFHGANEGLKVAEIELPAPDAAFSLLPFVGEEVTGDPAYYNSNLSSQA